MVISNYAVTLKWVTMKSLTVIIYLHPIRSQDYYSRLPISFQCRQNDRRPAKSLLAYYLDVDKKNLI